jgi:hypothetical protein
LEAVDPWQRADQLLACSAKWEAQPRVNRAGELLILPMPVGCGQHHVCPVCAARKSRELAREVRCFVGRARSVEIAELDRVGHVALVTLTHRDKPGETLHQALGRWRRAWRLMMRGRSGRRLRKSISGYYYGIEVTRGAAWWHLHAHVVVGLRILRPGRKPRGQPRPYYPVVVADIRREIAKAWQRATAKASLDAYQTERWGSDPLAGCWADCPEDCDEEHTCETAAEVRERMATGDYSGGWWREIPVDDDRAIHEATKYATPAARLDPLYMCEFLSASHGRKWHEGGFGWRSIRRDAQELLGEEMIEDCERADLGEALASLAPGHCPLVDEIAEGYGRAAAPDRLRHWTPPLPRPPPGDPGERSVRFVLLEDARELAEQWAEEGWCEVQHREETRLVPCKAGATDDAILRVKKHPSGRIALRWYRPVVDRSSVLVMSARLAAETMIATDDLLRDRPTPDRGIDVELPPDWYVHTPP